MTATYLQTIALIRNVKIMPRWIIFVLDLICGVFAMLATLLFKYSVVSVPISWPSLQELIISTLVINCLLFSFLRTFKGIVRYTGLQDALRVLLVASASALAIYLQSYFLGFGTTVINELPSLLILYALFIFLFLLGYRVIVKYTFHFLRSFNQIKKNIVIYGAGLAGQATNRVLENERIGFSLLAFVDDDKRKDNKHMDGAPVITFEKFKETALHDEIHEVIIASFSLPPERKNELVDFCLSRDINVLTIPRYTLWANGDFSAKQLKKIKIEDLLEREPIQIDNKQLLADIKGKRILITGAAGSIGSELVRMLNRLSPASILLCDQAETPLHNIEVELSENRNNHQVQLIPYLCDINNTARMEALFDRYQPHLIYHAAAYKHVPMMEINPEEAVKVNALGTQILADLAIKYNVERFVMISTDKAVNPTNVMGASKRLAEMYVQSLSMTATKTKFITTRFGNVLGSNGSVILRFREQIERGGPVTVTHPHIVRYFMTIPEACQLVLEAGSMANGGEIFVFDMGQPVKISDLAKKMIRLSGQVPNIDISIQYTGLRPGEKLYEELLVDAENSIKTYHEKIMIAKIRITDPNSIIEGFQLLQTKLNQKGLNSFELVGVMKQLVPEFVSNNSEYEQLDTTKVVKLKNG